MAKIKQRFDCQIGCHPDTAPMISDRDFFRNFGYELEIEPVEPDFLIEATPARDFLGLEMEVLGSAGPLPGKSVFPFPEGRAADWRRRLV